MSHRQPVFDELRLRNEVGIENDMQMRMPGEISRGKSHLKEPDAAADGRPEGFKRTELAERSEESRDLLVERRRRMLEREREQLRSIDGFDPGKNIGRDPCGLTCVAEWTEPITAVPGVNLNLAGEPVANKPGLSPTGAKRPECVAGTVWVKILKRL